MPYQGDMLISWRVIALFQFSNVNCIIACVNCRGLFRRLAWVMHCTCAATSCCKHLYARTCVCVFCHNNMDTYDFTIYISYMILYLYISHGSLCFKWMFWTPSTTTHHQNLLLADFPRGKYRNPWSFTASWETCALRMLWSQLLDLSQ